MADNSGTGIPFRRVVGADDTATRPAAPVPGRAAVSGHSPEPEPARPVLSPGQIAADRAEAETLMLQAATRAGTVRSRLAAIGQEVERQREAAAAHQREVLGGRRGEADALRDQRLADLDARFRQEAAELSASVVRAAESLAPGSASADWPDVSLPSGKALDVPGCTRFGVIETASGARWPALAPLLGSAGWLVQGRAAEGRELLRSAILRVATTVPIKHLRIVGFDPKIEGSLGLFAPLRAANATSFEPPSTGPAAFKDRLMRVVESAAHNAEQLNADGVGSLRELWRRDGMASGEFTLVAILNYPDGISDEAHDLLVRLAQTGGPRGVTLLVQSVSSKAAKPLARALTSRRFSDELWQSSVLPAAIPVMSDGPVPQTEADRILGVIAEAASSAAGPVEPLLPLIADDVSNPWQRRSIDALAMRIGVKGRTPLDIELRTANPPLPNMLVGGAVGQGKSNLLLDIVYSLAARYSPDELQLLLLDFKRGLEFKRFDADDEGKNWLPHAAVLSLESNKDFGLAVLEHVEAELGRRSNAFKGVGANSIREYREATNESMPRWLLIVDEFHLLFDGDDEQTDRAVALLENIARQGRAYGIHLLLASQTISGIAGLRTKGDSIFAQFPIRASLKNTAMESQALLSQHNTAAAELTYRGEIVLNRNFGLDPAGSNERVLAAYAEPAEMTELQSKLWQLQPDGQPPMVFLGEDYSRWDRRQLAALRESAAPTADQLLRVWVGRPIAVTDVPLEIMLDRDVDQAIAVLGPNQALVGASMAALAATAALSLTSDAKVVVLDGLTGPGTPTPPWLEAVVECFERRRVPVRTIARQKIGSYLAGELRGELADAGPDGPARLLLGIDLQRVADMTRDIPDDPASDFPQYFTPADVLREATTRGATSGHFFIGAWSTLRTLTEHLGHGHDGIGHYVLAGLGGDDLREVLGPMFKVDGFPRTVLADRRSDAGNRVVVPFAPLDQAELSEWGEA